MSHSDSSQDANFSPPSLEELAALLPQFELKDFLAQGGMGAVYLARQVSLDRLVAIKVLPPAWGADAGYAQLFQTEARAMAKLQHNHIVGVFDFGITTEGHFYLVMEYVPGQTLHDMIRLKKLPLAKVQGLALQICDAVSYAHEHGVLHRDIKPGNVLVSSAGEVKIADFGLARHAGAAVEEESLGTPDYAAPELFATGALVDHRADIFALGIVIQEMLTGKVPRRPRESLMEHGVYDPGWEPLIATATHENPARRFRTVREMREAVTNVTKRAKPATLTGAAPGVPRSGGPRGRPYVPPPSAEPSSFPWMSILAGLVIVAVAGTWWWRNRAEVQGSTPPPPSAPMAANPPAGPSPSNATPSESSSPATAGSATSAKDKPFTPGAAFTLAPVPPGHIFKLPEGHKDVIYSLAVFPDQHHVATGSADGTIGVWDLQTGERIRTFGPVPGSVSRLAVSPDGHFIASSANDYKVTLWSMDGASDTPAKELATTARSASYLLFSEDGKTLVIATSDAAQTLVVWDWEKSMTAEVVPGLRSTVNGLDRASGISRGAMVVSGIRTDPGQMGTELWVVDVARRSLVRQLAAPPSSTSLFRMKVTPDGRSAVAVVSGKVSTWDLESGMVVARSDAPTSVMSDLELLDGGRLVLYGSQDRCLHIMETITGKDVWTSGPADSQCTNVSASLSAGHYAVTAGGWRSGNPNQKDGDYSLHTWALPDLATLQSGEADKARARLQMLTLEKDDAELWALLTKLAEEWAEKASFNPAAGHKDLDEKYLSAVRREMSSASPRDREAFLSEISRIANGATGTLAAGSPQSLIRLHEIYQQQIALIPQKAQSARAELSSSHQAQLDELEKKRSGAADAAGAARVQLVRQALKELNGEMVLAKLQAHFLPKKPEASPMVSVIPGSTITSTGTIQSILSGGPLPAVGQIPPYTSPRRGLTRPVSLHRVEVWPRKSNNVVQTGISRIPADLGPVVALAVGARHALALKPDGTVVQWGHEDPRISPVPEGVDHIVAIDAGSNCSACLRDDGVVIAWNNRQILTQIDGRPAIEVTATFSNVMARHEDGSLSYIMTSPSNGAGATTNVRSIYTPPTDLTDCVQVCAASGCAFALKRDGTVIGWGRSTQPNAINLTDKMPQQELVNGICITSLTDLGLMLKRTGEIIAWGQNVPAELSNRPRFPGATRIIGGRPFTGLAIGYQPGIWKFLSLSDNRYPIDTEIAEQKARGCTEIGIGQYFILGLRPL